MWHVVTDILTAPELATRMSHEPLHLSWYVHVAWKGFVQLIHFRDSPSLVAAGWIDVTIPGESSPGLSDYLSRGGNWLRTTLHFSSFTFHKHTAFASVAPVREKMSNLGFSLKKTIPDGSSPGNRARDDLMGKQYWLCQQWKCHCSILALFFSQEEGRIKINVFLTCIES